MSYISHINKYASSQAIQDALDAGTLANPYVAMTTAGTPALDYNTLEPTPPAPTTMGTWTGKSFQITETGTTYWGQPVKIGVLNDVYMDGNQDSPDVTLIYNSAYDEWHMEFYSEIASNTPSYDFPSDVEGSWSTGVMTDPNESNSEIVVVYDGANNFTFTIADGFLTTINPEYPAGE